MNTLNLKQLTHQFSLNCTQLKATVGYTKPLPDRINNKNTYTLSKIIFLCNPSPELQQRHVSCIDDKIRHVYLHRENITHLLTCAGMDMFLTCRPRKQTLLKELLEQFHEQRHHGEVTACSRLSLKSCLHSEGAFIADIA